ncbi:MAG: hypothetical protein HY924_05205 [Elusimicrobia bacterium]|nr:hypothetical protein [Elusimicrobiota bacterium]
MKNIERISWKGRLLACVVRGRLDPRKTAFLTPPEFNLQVGFVAHPAGGVVDRHLHRPLRRSIIGTSEVLVVKKGRCWLDVYDDGRKKVATRLLRAGDILFLVAGGHGFRMLEDTVFLEVKQGPYTGLDEKERF